MRPTRIELATFGLKDRRSLPLVKAALTTELRAPRRHFTRAAGSEIGRCWAGMDLGLEGRTALVMGASRGIGRAIAAALAREGCRVAIASRSRERIEEAAAAIEGGADAVRRRRLRSRAARRRSPARSSRGARADRRSSSPTPAGRRSAAPSSTSSRSGRRPTARWSWRCGCSPGPSSPACGERGWGRIVNVGSTSTREPIPGLNLSNSHRMAAVGFLKTLAARGRRRRDHRQHGRHRPLRHRAARRRERLAGAGRRGGQDRSAGRPPRPARRVRRPGRLPLLRARRLHHRHRDPDRRRPRSRSLSRPGPALLPHRRGRGSRRAGSWSR